VSTGHSGCTPDRARRSPTNQHRAVQSCERYSRHAQDTRRRTPDSAASVKPGHAASAARPRPSAGTPGSTHRPNRATHRPDSTDTRPLCVRGRRVPGAVRAADEGETGYGRGRKVHGRGRLERLYRRPAGFLASTCHFRLPGRRRRARHGGRPRSPGGCREVMAVPAACRLRLAATRRTDPATFRNRQAGVI
jgi:hypothetical protein